MTIMSGLPASGKSTRAKEILGNGNTVRINKDLLRTMLHFDKFTHRNEGHTHDASVVLAEYFLSKGIDVIIDDTNLNPKIMQGWKDIAKKHEAKIQHEDIATSPEECMKRDSMRENSVGPTVIAKMAMERLGWLKGEKVVLCDLDGTICDLTHRLHYGKGDTKDWNKFFAGIPGDKPRKEVLSMVNKTCIENGARLIFVSARPETYREQTIEWLSNNTEELDEEFLGESKPWLLFMRSANDKRPDTEVKAEIFDRYFKHLHIVKVFDDRPSVIRMWRDKGLTVEDVGEGIEF